MTPPITYVLVPHHMRDSVVLDRMQDQNVLIPSTLVFKSFIFVPTPFVIVIRLVFFLVILFRFVVFL